MSKLIILDRDGVINQDSEHYVKTPDQWQAIEKSPEAIAKLNNLGFKVAVATNQSGIARGYFSKHTLNAIHEKMQHTLQKHGAVIHKIAFCPHHPDENCACRKPKPGMLHDLMAHFQIPAHHTWMIGDRLTDVQAALFAGVHPILVGPHRSITKTPKNIPYYPNLAAFVETLDA